MYDQDTVWHLVGRQDLCCPWGAVAPLVGSAHTHKEFQACYQLCTMACSAIGYCIMILKLLPGHLEISTILGSYDS